MIKLETTWRIRHHTMNPGHASLEIVTWINNEEMCGSFVCLSGKLEDIEEYIEGKIDLKEVRRRWGFKS